MKTLKIGFSRPINKNFPIFSLLIRLFQFSSYSHTYLSFYSETLDREIIYEAHPKGVRFIGTNTWKQHQIALDEYILKLTDDEYKTIMRYCVDNVGVKYAMWQNVGVFIAELFKLKKNPFYRGKNCSELLSFVFAKKGFVFNKEPNLITPRDIKEAAEQLCLPKISLQK